VWRIVQSGNTGLFHVVGAGKTAVMRHRQHGVAPAGFRVNKPCHVVPNHMLAQYTAEFVRLYPNASVLMAGKEDLEGDRRRELVSRIATGDWDAVVITHSSFERIRMSPRFSERFIKEIIHEIEMAVRAEKSNDRSNRIVKQLEAMKKNWAVRLEKLSGRPEEGRPAELGTLGIDCPVRRRGPPAQEPLPVHQDDAGGGPAADQFGARLRSVPEDALHDAASTGMRSAAWCSRRRRRWPTPWPRSTP
jgi:N12 class adenine-specific DNA methylase